MIIHVRYIMVIDPVGSGHTSKSAKMIQSGCKTTPHEQSAHDQKYNPFRRLNRQNRERLISIPIYHDIPAKAAMVMDMGRSFLIEASAIMCEWMK